MIYFAGGAAGLSNEGLPHLAVQLTVHSASIAWNQGQLFLVPRSGTPRVILVANSSCRGGGLVKEQAKVHPEDQMRCL